MSLRLIAVQLTGYTEPTHQLAAGLVIDQQHGNIVLIKTVVGEWRVHGGG